MAASVDLPASPVTTIAPLSTADFCGLALGKEKSQILRIFPMLGISLGFSILPSLAHCSPGPFAFKDVKSLLGTVPAAAPALYVLPFH